MLARQIAVLARGVVMFTLLFFHVLGCTPVGAQVSGGTLSGVVTDPSGAVIQNTKISAKNTATGVVRAVTADGEGLYTIANLLPGNYEIAAAATGFATAMQSAVTVTVGAQQTLNIRMQVGQETERVQVTAAAPLVELSLSSIVAVVDSTTIRELPLNGRSWSDLATLQPSVNAIETQKDFSVGSGRGNRGFGAQVTISGARPQQNNYRLDGVSMNDYANGAPGVSWEEIWV